MVEPIIGNWNHESSRVRGLAGRLKEKGRYDRLLFEAEFHVTHVSWHGIKDEIERCALLFSRSRIFNHSPLIRWMLFKKKNAKLMQNSFVQSYRL